MFGMQAGMCYYSFAMEKSTLQTVAVIVAVFMAAWAIRGDIANNTVAEKDKQLDICQNNIYHYNIDSIHIWQNNNER